MRLIWCRDRNDWVPRDEYYTAPPERLQLMPDSVDYRSPIDGRPITSRREAREDLARSGCRVLEKGEWSRDLVNPKYAADPRFNADKSRDFYAERAERGAALNRERALAQATMRKV
jgi:hypothetical protein